MVFHKQERIQEGETVVLTLKDKGVLDEEDDTLVNVNMIDDEKFEKVRAQAYNCLLGSQVKHEEVF